MNYRTTKKYISFYIFLLPFFCFSQLSVFNSFKTESQLINSVSEHYSKFEDTVSLSRFISEQAKILGIKNEKKSVIMISSIFLANKTSDVLQNYNDSSTRLFQKAIAVAEKSKRKDFYIWANLNYGNYLYTYRRYKEAFPYIIKCDQKVNTISDNKIFQPSKTYKLLGFFFFTAQEYQKSIDLLKKSIQLSPDHSKTAVQFDNIGLNLLKLNKLKEAESHFNKAQELAQKSNDKLRFVKVLGNMGTMKHLQKKYGSAEKLFLKDIEISMVEGNDQNTMYALIQLAKVYCDQNHFAKAKETLQKAEKIALSKPQFKSSELEIVQILQKIAGLEGDHNKDLIYRKKADSLTFMLNQLDGKYAIHQINWETQKENLKYQLHAEKAQSERQFYVTTAIILFSILLVATVFFVMKSYRSKWKIEKFEYEKKVLSLALEKEQSENKLNNSEQTIASFKTYIQEKNSQIVKLENTLVNIKNSSQSYLEKNSGELENLLKSHLMTAENWEHFKILFIKEYPDYYTSLTEKFPDLTESNLRIIFLSKLELNNTEISRILGVGVDAVKKSKQRLRKKYPERFTELL